MTDFSRLSSAGLRGAGQVRGGGVRVRSWLGGSQVRYPAKKQQLKRLEGLVPAGRGQNLALTVLYVHYSLDSGLAKWASGPTNSHVQAKSMILRPQI